MLAYFRLNEFDDKYYYRVLVNASLMSPPSQGGLDGGKLTHQMVEIGSGGKRPSRNVEVHTVEIVLTTTQGQVRLP